MIILGIAYLGRVSLALERSTEIIDNNTSTSRSKEESILFSKPSTCSGNDDYLVIIS